MANKKEPHSTVVAVRLPTTLDEAIEKRCKRAQILKRDFIALACRKLLEATNA